MPYGGVLPSVFASGDVCSGLARCEPNVADVDAQWLDADCRESMAALGVRGGASDAAVLAREITGALFTLYCCLHAFSHLTPATLSH